MPSSYLAESGDACGPIPPMAPAPMQEEGDSGEEEAIPATEVEPMWWADAAYRDAAEEEGGGGGGGGAWSGEEDGTDAVAAAAAAISNSDGAAAAAG